MNRRDLLKGFAAAGVTVVAAKSVAFETSDFVAELSTPDVEAYIENASEIIIDLDKAVEYSIKSDNNLRTYEVAGSLTEKDYGFGRLDETMSVTLYPESELLNPMVELMDSRTRVVIVSKKMDIRRNALIEQCEIYCPGADHDIQLTLDLRLVK